MHNIKSKEMVSTIDKSKFSKKFYIGIALIISSLIVGKITQAIFVIYFTNEFIRKLAVIIYIITWPPFILGIVWAGTEYVNKYNRFFTFKFYKDKFISIRE
jgi:hypothetical protein